MDNYIMDKQELKQRLIDKFCDSLGLIKKDGLYNSPHNISLWNLGLTRFPIKFGIIGGSFSCVQNNLTTLEGAPHTIIGSFDCSYNNLSNLEGGPKNISGSYICNDNQLTSLRGCTISQNGIFDCSYNNLTNLDGYPQDIMPLNFNCSHNKLTSLLSGPKTVNNMFNCTNNQLTNLDGCPLHLSSYFYCINNKIELKRPEKLECRGFFN